MRIDRGARARTAVKYGLAAALVALTSGALALGASAAKPSVPVSVHAIFDANAKAPFRVGQIVDVLPTRTKPSPGKITKICFSPAPIALPACGKSAEAAPSAVGVTKITVSFSKRAPYVLKVKVLPAATKVGGDQGGLAVPATITCPSVALYQNVHQALTKTGQPAATLPKGTEVALYNTIAPNTILMIDYATGANGFADESCATPGI